jgi:hypothetical protein
MRRGSFFLGFSDLGAGRSKDGLEQDAPATGRSCGFIRFAEFGTKCSKDRLGLQVPAIMKKWLLHLLPQ